MNSNYLKYLAGISKSDYILNEEYTNVEPITHKDIDSIIELANDILINEVNENVPYQEYMKIYLQSMVNWNISAKLIYDEKLIGFFLLGTQDLPPFNDKAQEYYNLGNGIQGIGIGIKSEYRGAGFVRRLLRHVLSIPNCNYIWGGSYSFYGLNDSWGKLGEYIGELEGANIFARKLKPQ